MTEQIKGVTPHIDGICNVYTLHRTEVLYQFTTVSVYNARAEHLPVNLEKKNNDVNNKKTDGVFDISPAKFQNQRRITSGTKRQRHKMAN